MLAYHEQQKQSQQKGKVLKKKRCPSKRVNKALTQVADTILQNRTIGDITKAQTEAMAAGATDDEYSDVVWKARRTLQGRIP